MSQLAKKICEENKRTQNKTLDIGRCGLTKLPDLSGMDWVETLILSDRWGEFDDKTKRWIGVSSQNSGGPNKLDMAQAPFVDANSNSLSVLNTVQFTGKLDKKHNQYFNITVAPEFKVQNMNTMGDGNKGTQQQ